MNLFKIALFILLIFIVVLDMQSCISSSALKNKTNSKIYNLGKATEYDFYQTIPRTLRKYQFQVLEDYDTGGYHTIQTDWKHRLPYADEQDVGILEGKIRLIIRIRKVSEQLGYVRLEVENMVRTTEDRVWFYSSMSKMLESEIMRMVEELDREFAESRLRRS